VPLKTAPGIDELRVGDTATAAMRIGRDQIAAFAALSGDTNPLHLDGDVASANGFERPIAHGLISLSVVSRLIGTVLPGPGSLWVSQTVRFSAPVLVGDEVVARVTVEQISKGTGLVALRTEVLNVTTDAVVLSGNACVRVGARMAAPAEPGTADPSNTA
jgi:acyl dehydratase